MKTAVVLGMAFVLIVVGTVLFTRQRDKVDALRDVIETQERLDNADVSTGNADDNRAWVDDFLGRLRPADQ